MKEGEVRGAPGEVEEVPSTDGIEAIKAGCERFLSRHRPRKIARAWLEELAASPAAELPPELWEETVWLGDRREAEVGYRVEL